MLYACNGILFSPKNVGNFDTCYNMDESWYLLSEISFPQKDKYCMVLLIQDT